MKTNRRGFLTIAVLAACGATVHGAERKVDPKRITVIEVDDMHCANCAKKIARKLYAVPGVVQVKTNVKANRAYVIPQAKSDPAAIKLWNAIKAAGFEPMKMSGPQGSFTQKSPPKAPVQAALSTQRSG